MSFFFSCLRIYPHGGCAILFSFLNDLERIASRSYKPSDNDVVRARLRTLGVQEYKFDLPTNTNNILTGTSILSHLPFDVTLFIPASSIGGIEFGGEWRIYDVGGSRTMVLSLFQPDVPYGPT